MTEISVGFTIVIPGSLDPGMHFGLEVKRLKKTSDEQLILKAIILQNQSVT